MGTELQHSLCCMPDPSPHHVPCPQDQGVYAQLGMILALSWDGREQNFPGWPRNDICDHLQRTAVGAVELNRREHATRRQDQPF